MKALGLIEVIGLPPAIEAADVALKSADVVLLSIAKADAGILTVQITGEVDAVTAAVEAGAVAAGRIGTLRAKHVIPRVDESLVGKVIIQENKLFQAKKNRINRNPTVFLEALTKEAEQEITDEKIKDKAKEKIEKKIEKKIDKKVEEKIEQSTEKAEISKEEKVEEIADEKAEEVLDEVAGKRLEEVKIKQKETTDEKGKSAQESSLYKSEDSEKEIAQEEPEKRPVEIAEEGSREEQEKKPQSLENIIIEDVKKQKRKKK